MKDPCRVEPFDLMQYFYRRAHDPIIHAVIRTGGRIDPDRLGEAFRLSCQTVPVIACSFSIDGKKPRWQPQAYESGAFVDLVLPEADEAAAEARSLTSTIDIAKGPQVKAGIIRKRDGDTVCVLLNHMIGDGGGFKEYLYLVCLLYNSLCTQGGAVVVPPPVSRKIGQVFSAFGPAKEFACPCRHGKYRPPPDGNKRFSLLKIRTR